jgi:hypothetical protein
MDIVSTFLYPNYRVIDLIMKIFTHKLYREQKRSSWLRSEA